VVAGFLGTGLAGLLAYCSGLLVPDCEWSAEARAKGVCRWDIGGWISAVFRGRRGE
jgi:hypothetical protein